MEIVAGALVTEDWARAPTAKARKAAVYFILEIGSRDAIEVVREDKCNFELVCVLED